MFYHVILGFLFGGFPLGSCPDEEWVISLGIYLVENVSPEEFVGTLVAKDKPLLLPLFIGYSFKLFGFPTFLYILFTWGVAQIGFLMLGVYLLAREVLDKRTAYIATLIVGWNWHIGWYAHRLLNDVMAVGLALVAAGLLSLYLREPRLRYLVFSGVVAGLALWTKEVSLYILLPFLVYFIIVRLRQIPHKTLLRDILCIIFSTVVVSTPFMAICALKLGNPILPFLLKVHKYLYATGSAHKRYLFFHTYYIYWILFALGLFVTLLAVFGLFLLIKCKKLLIPLWFFFLLSIYVFIYPFRVYDHYSIHYTPLLIIAASYGLWRILDAIRYRLGNKEQVYLIISGLFIAFILVNTNLYGPPLFYSFSRKAFYIPITLYQKMCWDKFGAISKLVFMVEEKRSETLLAKLFITYAN